MLPVRRLVAVAIFLVALWAAPGALAAGWCGPGETAADAPDIVTGPQVHAIYVVPSDGADRFAQVAGQIADDTASIDAWWLTQDPTRTLRFDLAVYPACTALDLSFLRLQLSAAQISGDASSAFALVEQTVAQQGFANPFKRYLVYYDGPAVQNGVCGTGGGSFATGPAFAVVWLAGCPGVPTDSVAAHELLHALGALPAGAPHACPGDPGHPCDSPTDVLYPVTTGAPLQQQVLDFGHDDYYAHAGSWLDIQDSAWLHRVDLPQEPLAVTIQGTGTVASRQPGVACAATCTTQWDQGSPVTLDAVPSAQERLIRWTGPCAATFVCSLTMTQAQSLTAVFGPKTIAVRTSVAGRGRIACTPRCSPSFAAGSALTLRAAPAKGWRFVRWSGACAGTATVCRPATDYALAARATFAKQQPKKPKQKRRV